MGNQGGLSGSHQHILIFPPGYLPPGSAKCEGLEPSATGSERGIVADSQQPTRFITFVGAGIASWLLLLDGQPSNFSGWRERFECGACAKQGTFYLLAAQLAVLSHYVWNRRPHQMLICSLPPIPFPNPHPRAGFLTLPSFPSAGFPPTRFLAIHRRLSAKLGRKPVAHGIAPLDSWPVRSREQNPTQTANQSDGIIIISMKSGPERRGRIARTLATFAAFNSTLMYLTARAATTKVISTIPGPTPRPGLPKLPTVDAAPKTLLPLWAIQCDVHFEGFLASSSSGTVARSISDITLVQAPGNAVRLTWLVSCALSQALEPCDRDVRRGCGPGPTCWKSKRLDAS